MGHCSERRGLPVGLFHLFPHDHVEAATVLVTEEEACIVIISDCVHMEGAFKVHAIKGRVSWMGTGEMLGAVKLPGGLLWVGMGTEMPAAYRTSKPLQMLHLPPTGAFPLEITELGVLYIPTARPGSLFIV